MRSTMAFNLIANFARGAAEERNCTFMYNVEEW